MSNVVVISKRAKKFLGRVRDRKLRERLEEKIDSLARHPLISNSEKIQGEDHTYRIRVGNYRILYDYTPGLILVIDIGHRREVYR